MSPHAQFRAVVFDFGGVLISPITEKVSELAARNGTTLPVLLSVLMGPHEPSLEHPWHRAERGEIPTADIQGLLGPWAEAAGLELRGDEVDTMLTPSTYELHHDLIARISTLKQAGYRTGLLTNSFAEFRPNLETVIDLALFDVIVDSSVVGSRKPEPSIYTHMTDGLGLPPDQILYLDDFHQNVVGAEREGWTVIHVTSQAQAIAALDELLS